MLVKYMNAFAFDWQFYINVSLFLDYSGIVLKNYFIFKTEFIFVVRSIQNQFYYLKSLAAI